MRAVPMSLREGSYAMGATRFQTAVRVVVPAALSGIASAYILGISRAVGETMIVAVAMTGRSRGRTIRQKTRDGDAPSIRAASSSSRGMARMKPVMKKIDVDIAARSYTKPLREHAKQLASMLPPDEAIRLPRFNSTAGRRRLLSACRRPAPWYSSIAATPFLPRAGRSRPSHAASRPRSPRCGPTFRPPS